jgi:hypothetical protein
MNCHKCGACCIAPSIMTPMPGMPHGKPAGMRCANLSPRNACTLYGQAGRPAFCLGWQPAPEYGGQSLAEALINITALEQATA